MGARGDRRIAVHAVAMWVGAWLSSLLIFWPQTVLGTDGYHLPKGHPALSLVKAVGEVRAVENGNFAVYVQLNLSNSGDVLLDHLQVIDDVADQIAPARLVRVENLSVAGDLTAFNPAFDGISDTRLLGYKQSLAAGESGRIGFVLIFDPQGNPGPFYNLAYGSGKNRDLGVSVSTCSRPGPLETYWSDTNDCQPTKIELPPPEAQIRVGLAKSASTPRLLGDGTFETLITLTVQNFGGTDLTELQVRDDLAATFPKVDFSVNDLQSSTLTVNPGFDGRYDDCLLVGKDQLPVGASATVTFAIRFAPHDTAGEFFNSATVSSGNGADDRSTDGTDPDPDGDGNPTEQLPTPIRYEHPPTRTVVGLANAASATRYLGDGVFATDITVTVENLGDVELRGVQISNDLAATFASGVESFTVVAGSLTSPSLAVNADFDGSSDTSLLLGNDCLPPGAKGQLSFTVMFSPIGESGTFYNASVATTGEGASDVSTDGQVPDPDGDGNPQEATPTPISYQLPDDARPILGLAKRAAFAQPLGAGEYRSVIILELANLGNVTARGVNISDDLAATFAAAEFFEVEPGSLTAEGLTANPQFDGTGNTRLLGGDDELAPGETATVSFSVRFRPVEESGVFLNSAIATAGNANDDISTDGADPDPNGDGDPRESVATPIAYAPAPAAPAVGVAKAASESVLQEDGSFMTQITVTVQNFGDVALSDLQLIDDLVATFSTTDFSVQDLGSSTLTVNPGFDGRNDSRLLGGGDQLGVGASATVTFRVNFRPAEEAGEFFNSVQATTGNGVGDQSTNGIDPDPNGDGAADESTPTPIRYERVAPGAIVGLAKAAGPSRAAGDGEFVTTMTFVVENLGAIALTALQITDDLTLTVPDPATFAVVPGTLMSTSLAVNAQFDGRADRNLLTGGDTLAVGASASLSLDVRFSANGLPGPFLNQAFATTAQGASDTSTNGPDPDPDGDGNPSEDDRTPIYAPAAPEDRPAIGLAKAASSVTPDGDGYLVDLSLLLVNLGNVPLANVQVMDDLRSTFPEPVTFTIVGVPLVSGALSEANGAFGEHSTALLSGAETLAVGEQASIEFRVRFVANGEPGPFFNQAFASGIAPDGGSVFDPSTAGTNPDPNGNGSANEPGENQPTPITLPGGPDGTRGAIEGTVFLDVDHDGVLGVDESGQHRWAIELLDARGAFIDDVATNEDGFYSLPELPAGDYFVQWRHPETGVTWGRIAAHVQANIVLTLDLPINSQGLIYDSVTRELVPGVSVALTTIGGELLPDVCLLPDQQQQQVGSDAAYRFEIQHGADADCPLGSADYTTRITAAPPGYLAQDSTRIPPRNQSFDTVDCANPCLVQTQNGPPRGTAPTEYFTTYTASDSARVLINNHLPIDAEQAPPPATGLTIDKQASRRTATVGSVIGYTIAVQNLSDFPASGIVVTDQPPPGFTLHSDSAQLVRAGFDGRFDTPDDIRSPIASNGVDPVRFAPIDLAAGDQVQIRYAMRVTTGVRPGPFTNTAIATDGIVTTRDTATVEVTADPLFDQATIIGTVFNDANGNGHQDGGEAGVPGVRLITAEGLVIETDRHGRYHIADIDVPRMYGANFAVKLDANTLPNGGYSRTDPRQVAHLFAGDIAKLNFAVSFDDTRNSCCGPYREHAVIDPFRTEKLLDVRVQSIQQSGSFWSFEFLTASNYVAQARYQEVAVYEPEDVGFSRPLGRTCTEVDQPANLIQVSGVNAEGHDRLVYLLRVSDDENTCDANGGPGGSGRDRTEAQIIDLVPGGQPARSAIWEGRASRLHQAGNPVSRVVRELRVTDRPTTTTVSDVLTEPDPAVTQLVPTWTVHPLPVPAPVPSALAPAEQLDKSSELEVNFDWRGVDSPRPDEPRVELTRSPAGDGSCCEDQSITYAAEGLTTSVTCCELPTSVKTVIDQDNDVISVRVTNRSARALTATLQFPDVEAQSLVEGYGTYERALRAGSTTEFFIGRFLEGSAPRDISGWTKLTIDVFADDAPDQRVRYEIERERDEENGQWRPPRTAAICLDVRAEPQITEDAAVAAFRLQDGGEATQARPAAGSEANFGIALVDLTLGGYSSSGQLTELLEQNDLDESSYVDGRIAAFWRGKANRGLEREYRWVVQVDSTKDDLANFTDNLKRKDPDRLFRQLDADLYYPTYGDDSTTISATDSQGALYARLEVDDSTLLWGNYTSGLTGTEFASYNRSLYGAYLDYKSSERTGFGDSRYQLKAFGSEAQSLSASAVFQATGGSLYYLRHTDIVMGSEKVWVEVRRRDTEQVEEREVLIAGRDYEIDPFQGRILLRRPLSQVVRERHNNVIRSRPLEGDDVLLLVDYEYVPDGFEANNYLFGLRGRTWLGEHVSVGATHVSDDQGNADYSLNGVDVILRHSADTYLSAEFARSDAARGISSLFSADGGLTFEGGSVSVPGSRAKGDALGFEAQVNLADLGAGQGLARAWWKERREGFFSSRFDLGPTVTDLGVDYDGMLSRHWQLSGSATELERADVSRTRTARLQTTGRWRCRYDNLANATNAGCLQIDLEGRHEDVELLTPADNFQPFTLPDGEATLIGARAGVGITDATTIYTAAQTTTSTDRGYESNDLVALGANTRFSEKLAMSLEASDGDRGSAVLAGADYSLGSKASFNLSGGVGSGAISQFSSRYTLAEGHELFGSYAVSPDRTDGQRNLLTLGQRRDVGNRMRIFTESQFGRDVRQASSGHVFGLEYDRTRNWALSGTLQTSTVKRSGESFDRTAMSAGVTFRNQTTRFSSRIEVRDDKGDRTKARQYVTSTALTHQLSEDARLLGKLNLAWVDDALNDGDAGRFVELDLGYAHRPATSDRFNWMGRYSYLYDVGTQGQSNAPGDERAHVVSAEGILEPFPALRNLRFGGKLALRKGESRMLKGTGEWLDTRVGMVVARALYKLDRPHAVDQRTLLINKLELVGEYRWLADFEGDSTQRGALLGIYRQFDPRLRDSDKEPGVRRLTEPSIRVGVGYNFSGFDDDMRREGYKSHGWFIDLMAVF